MLGGLQDQERDELVSLSEVNALLKSLPGQKLSTVRLLLQSDGDCLDVLKGTDGIVVYNVDLANAVAVCHHYTCHTHIWSISSSANPNADVLLVCGCDCSPGHWMCIVGFQDLSFYVA